MSKLLPLFLTLALTGCGTHANPAAMQLKAAQASRQAAPLDQQIGSALTRQFPGAAINVHNVGEAVPGTYGFQAEVVSRNRATRTHLVGEFDVPGQALRILDQSTESR
jgi:uncharacterized lipoprotein YmbA